MTTPPPDCAAIWVSAISLVNKSSHVLVQRRRIDATHGGLWEFPGGKVESGESPEVAGARELHEELGIRIDPGALVPVSFASGQTADGRPLVILLYACRSWDGEPMAHDAEELSWHDPAELVALAMPPLDYPLAEALRKFLRADAK